MTFPAHDPGPGTASLGRRAFLGCLAVGAVLPVPAAASGNSAGNTAVIRQLLEGVQRNGDFELFERLFARDYVDHTPFGGFPANRDGTRAIYQTFRAAFPDWRAEVRLQVAEGDLVTTYKTYHGTHLGPFLGIAPTGRVTRFAVMDIMRVHNGQITDHWAVADGAGLLGQLRGER